MKEGKLLLSELEQGFHDEWLKDIYVDECLVEGQKKRYEKAIRRYEELFGNGQIEVYSAPGRSEVGGNHTDHQYGRVLATSINLDAIAVVGLHEENCIQILSEGYEMLSVDLSDLSKREIGRAHV